jgi:hypothetical protein
VNFLAIRRGFAEKTHGIDGDFTRPKRFLGAFKALFIYEDSSTIILRLGVPHLFVEPVRLHQSLMVAFFGDFAFVYYDDVIAEHRGTHTVRDEDRSLAFHEV